MFELFFHIVFFTSLVLLFKRNNRNFLINISYLSITKLFHYAFISGEVAYEVN